ncbi:MAG: hypothetical protein JSW28_08145 [Thermoplasmata archaeon]|nr:MAG: hypothetical protein JSW28_08145 [Thermoplasmata archaeon]
MNEGLYMRYEGDAAIPEGFTEDERRDIEETLREFTHQFAMVEQFGDEALLVWKRLNEERGYRKGKYLIDKYEIEGTDIHTVKMLIQAYFDDDPKRTARPDIDIEDDKIIISSSGFCPLIETAKILKLDMSYMCPYSTRPYFLSMCRAVNPKVRHKTTKWRALGDDICREIFWIEG